MPFHHWVTGIDGVSHLVGDAAALEAADSGEAVTVCGDRIAPGSMLAVETHICLSCAERIDVHEIVTVYGRVPWRARRRARHRRRDRPATRAGWSAR